MKKKKNVHFVLELKNAVKIHYGFINNTVIQLELSTEKYQREWLCFAPTSRENIYLQISYLAEAFVS